VEYYTEQEGGVIRLLLSGSQLDSIDWRNSLIVDGINPVYLFLVDELADEVYVNSGVPLKGYCEAGRQARPKIE
jgi:hypothetical protein